MDKNLLTPNGKIGVMERLRGIARHESLPSTGSIGNRPRATTRHRLPQTTLSGPSAQRTLRLSTITNKPLRMPTTSFLSSRYAVTRSRLTTNRTTATSRQQVEEKARKPRPCTSDEEKKFPNTQLHEKIHLLFHLPAREAKDSRISVQNITHQENGGQTTTASIRPCPLPTSGSHSRITVFSNSFDTAHGIPEVCSRLR